MEELGRVINAGISNVNKLDNVFVVFNNLLDITPR